MKYKITAPTSITTEVQLPASKSISNRVLVLHALSYSAYDIENLSACDDTQVMLRALDSDGTHFDIKAAGTAMRFLTAFLSKIVGEWTITGTERMKQRPIKILVEALNSLGARIEYLEEAGYPPLKIFGSALQGGEISLNGGVSSQYISALLMVAPMMEKGLKLHLEGDIISKPYINLTLQLMKQFGVTSLWEGQTIEIAPQTYTPIPFKVESDWSAASYWYEAALFAPTAEIELLGLFKDSLQGDAHLVELFAKLGVDTLFTPQGVKLIKGEKRCTQLDYNFVNEPDMAQTFVVACLYSNTPFRFTGLQSLRIKETDRIAALQTEVRKLGYVLYDSEDSILEWTGERCTPEASPVIDTYEDHRMAMAFAPIALTEAGSITIAEPSVVSKSYPTYWEDLKQAGFAIEVLRATTNQDK